MPETDAAAKQLAEAIGYWLGRLETYGLAQRSRDPRSYAERVVADLDSDDDHIAAEAALAVSEWEPWTDHGRSDVPPEWWLTPLGRLTLLASSQTSGEMSVREAREVLGVSRARIYQMVIERKLTRGPGGGITRRSVARRMEPRAT